METKNISEFGNEYIELFNLEYEVNIIISALTPNTQLRNIIFSKCEEKFFYNTVFGKIFNTMLVLYNKNITFDILILSDCLKSESSIIDFLVTEVPKYLNDEMYSINPDVIGHYITRVKEFYKLRVIKTKLAEWNSKVETPMAVSFDILSEVETEIYELIKDTGINIYNEIDLSNTVDQILNDDPVPKIDTGFITLDELIGGLRKGNLIIIAGRPSHGKSALSLNIQNQIAERKIKTGLISIEMTEFENSCRLTAMRSQVDLLHIMDKRLSDEEREKILKLKETYKNFGKIYIDDKSYLLKDIVFNIKKMKKEESIELAVIDYLQIADDDKNKSNNRTLEIGGMTRRLKQLAKELDMPIILLSQLNRDIEKRGKSLSEPRLSDLRDSGSIEQDADVVIFIYRADIYEEPTQAELIVAKARNAKVGKMNYEFHPDYQLFYEM
jgi:replicative DNA helicase